MQFQHDRTKVADSRESSKEQKGEVRFLERGDGSHKEDDSEGDSDESFNEGLVYTLELMLKRLTILVPHRPRIRRPEHPNQSRSPDLVESPPLPQKRVLYYALAAP
jgi:hypothetical protein